jgi:hypothetical protein
MARGRPNGAKGKPLQGKHFLLASMAVHLGKKVEASQDTRMTLSMVARSIGLKDRASYHWSRGKVNPADPANGARPFIPPTSFEEARAMLEAHARAFIAGYEEENRKWRDERRAQLKAARDLLKMFGEESE